MRFVGAGNYQTDLEDDEELELDANLCKMALKCFHNSRQVYVENVLKGFRQSYMRV